MKVKLSLALITLGLSLTGLVNASDSLYVIKTIDVDAPASKTWEKLSKFGDLGAWHPAIAKTQIVLGAEGQAGADRELTLKDGGKINETLTAYNDNDKSMSYVITESVLPVNDYASTLRVLSNGDKHSVVVWEGSFKSKPAAGDKTALETISAVYEGGLANLKKLVE